MRWSFSSLAAAALAAACVTSTTRYFLPSPQNPSYTPVQAEPVLTEYLRLQCATLRAAQKPDSGIARFLLDVDSTGITKRAELQQTTRDDVLDGVFGTVAAQLTLPAGGSRPLRHGAVTMNFRCTGDSASVRVVTSGR
jgi:hypothetical protein